MAARPVATITDIGVASPSAQGQAMINTATALMEQEGVSVAALQADGERLRGEGASTMHLAVDGHFAGILAVTDSIKESTHEATKPCTTAVCASS